MDKDYLEKIILIMGLGLSEALKADVITYEDARSLLFLPILDSIEDMGVSEEVLDSITIGLDIVEYKEDGCNHKASELNKQLRELVLEVLASKKEINNIEMFWLAILLSDFRNNDFRLVKGQHYTSLFFPTRCAFKKNNITLLLLLFCRVSHRAPFDAL